MSLVFRIDSVHFDKNLHADQEKRSQWLKDRNLKEKYGNIKAPVEKDGFVIHKQKSRTDKVDHSQQVRVQLDTGVYAVGSYKNGKFKTLRQKRKKEGEPESQPETQPLQ